MKLYNSKVISFLLFIIVGIIVILKGPIYYPDSGAFFNMEFNRSPVYSLFLKLFSFIFGSLYEWPIIIFQYLFLVFSVIFFSNLISKEFKISLIEKTLLQLLILIPGIYLNFIAGVFLSEAISYPLVLVIFALAFNAFINKRNKPILISIIPLFLLILTRGQFIICIPVFILLSLHINFRNKKNHKKWLSLILLLVLPFITTITERIHNKIFYDHFVSNTMNFVHLITTDFYLSDAETANIFEDIEEQQLFNIVYKSLEEANLTYQKNKHIDRAAIAVFENEFSKICNRRVHELGLKYYQNKGLGFYQQNIRLNTVYRTMFFKMIKNNYKQRFVFFVKNLKSAYGTSKLLLLYLIILIYGAIYFIKTEEKLFKLILLFGTLMLLNNALIAFSVHAIKRYTFYFDWYLFAIIIISFSKIYKTAANEN